MRTHCDGSSQRSFCGQHPKFLILEYKADEPPRSDIVDEPIKLVDGYLEIPEKSRLGIDLNEEAFREFPFRSWHRAFPWREDGSLAFQ